MECGDVLLLWLLPPGAGSFGFQEGRRTQQAVGRWLAHPGVAKAGLRNGRRVQVGKRHGQFPWTSLLVGCG